MSRFRDCQRLTRRLVFSFYYCLRHINAAHVWPPRAAWRCQDGANHEGLPRGNLPVPALLTRFTEAVIYATAANWR